MSCRFHVRLERGNSRPLLLLTSSNSGLVHCQLTVCLDIPPTLFGAGMCLITIIFLLFLLLSCAFRVAMRLTAQRLLLPPQAVLDDDFDLCAVPLLISLQAPVSGISSAERWNDGRVGFTCLSGSAYNILKLRRAGYIL